MAGFKHPAPFGVLFLYPQGVTKSYLKAAETLDNSGKSGIVVADNNTTAHAPISQSYVMRFIPVEARSQLIGQATAT